MMHLHETNPLALIYIGFVLVLLGAVLPWLIVLGALESTFPLNFLAFIASFGGLMLGIVGIAYYSKTLNKK